MEPVHPYRYVNNLDQSSPDPHLPKELLAEIFSHSIASAEGPKQTWNLIADLSTVARGIAQEALRLGSANGRISLQSLGYESAEEAIDYLIQIKATVADLSGYYLSPELLERLLKRCPTLESLSIASIETLPKLPPNLKKLICYAGLIEKIENQEHLVELSCGGALQSISNLPKLQKLNCRHSPIEEIAQCDSLVELNCDCCYSLKRLSGLPNLRRVSCIQSGIELFSELPKLEVLICHYCFFLKHLENLPALKYLDCRHSAMKIIEEMPSLEALYCSNCYSLTTLPHSNRLRRLSADFCHEVKELPLYEQLEELTWIWLFLKELPLLPKLQKLSINCAHHLTDLPNFPLLKNLDCRANLKLERLPAFASLEQLDCGQNPKLKEIAEMAQLKEVACDEGLKIPDTIRPRVVASIPPESYEKLQK